MQGNKQKAGTKLLVKTHDFAVESDNKSKTKAAAATNVILNKRKRKKGLFYYIYANCYITGIKFKRFFKQINRKVSPVTRPVFNFLFRPIDFFIASPFKGLLRELGHFKDGFKKAGNYFKEAYKQNKLMVIPRLFTVFFKGIIHSKRLIAGTFNYVAPIVSALVLAYVIFSWTTVSYGLSVKYDGKNIGYVADEKVFNLALNLLESRIVDKKEELELKHTPQYYLSVIEEDNLDTSFSLCDKLISNSENVTEAAGLYIDDKLVCAVPEKENIDQVLDKTIEKKKQELSAKEASFAENVKVQVGVYPKSVIVSEKELEEKIAGNKVERKVYTIEEGDTLTQIAENTDKTEEEIKELNGDIDEVLYPGNEILIEAEKPNLDIKYKNIEKKTEKVPFKTVKKENIHRPPDYSEEKTQGVDGKKEIEEEVEFINGIEVSRKEIKATIIVEPIDKVIEIGATKDMETLKKHTNKSADIGSYATTGKFIWPVDGGFVSSNYGNRSDPFGRGFTGFHRGLDIAAPYGASIFASDAGKVEISGWYGGYGWCVIIDHGNGYKTLYGHCSSLEVETGEWVAKGKIIAKVGTTGDSTGNHCHFEVRQNEETLDPLNFVV